MLATLLALQIAATAANDNPFAFVQPSVAVTADDRRQLDGGEAIARVIPAPEREVAIFAAVPINIDGDRLVAWMRRIEALKKSPYVLAIRRFSDPPQLEDLNGLMLDDDELSKVVECRPGACGMKLSAIEMTELQRAAAENRSDWKRAVQERFRALVLQRVRTYLNAGLVGPFEDHSDAIWPARKFATLVDHSTFLTERLPAFAEHLRAPPGVRNPDVESFMYWSTERVANKAITSVTHVNIIRGHSTALPDVVVAGKEIFSTHYIDASLGVTALSRGAPGGPNYLVYVNRSEVDMLRGMFGGVIRWFMQRRLKAEAGDVLQGLRRRLESGEPPVDMMDRP